MKKVRKLKLPNLFYFYGNITSPRFVLNTTSFAGLDLLIFPSGNTLKSSAQHLHVLS